MQLTGHRVLITGGGSGIGLAIATAFNRLGNEVVICGRDRDRLERARLALPGAEAICCDVSDPAQVAAIAEQQAARVSILVNNAAISQDVDFLTQAAVDTATFREVEVNLLGTLRMSRAFVPAMLARPDAAIVNVTSGLAFVPLAQRPVYSATKAALHSLSQSLRHQLRGTSIKVFELIPPVTDTAMAIGDQGVPKMPPDDVASALVAGMSADRFEIAVGLSKAAKWMSRIAPGFALSQLNPARAKQSRAD